MAKKAVPAKKAAKKPTKKAAPAKKAATKPVKKAAKKVAKKPVKKAVPAKKPAKKAAKKPVKKVVPAKKAATKPAKKAPPAKKAAPVTKTASAAKPESPAVVEQAPAKPKIKPIPKSQMIRPKPKKRPKVREDESPWTAAELRAVEETLHEEVRRLEEEIETAELGLADLIRDSGDGAGDDQADAGSKTFEREHEMSLARNARDMRDQAHHALARIADGSYGQCESCGNPIGKYRLQAFPRATLCVICKESEERFNAT